ncbi:MAG: exosortase C-terminal domain/associated protein EpsI [Bryobacteraceae bacterium]|jgi:EpsI family protein
MTAPKTILVPIFLSAQALLVHWTANFERPPAKPDLEQFPAQIGSWQRTGEQPVDDATKAQLGADRLMNSMYVQQPNGEFLNLFVAWFQSQRAGTSQPHSPQVCLPASGWIPESNGTIDIETGAGRITVNRYVIAKGAERAVVLYWYQTPRRVIANEWAAKFWLMADAPRDHRTDTSLVRVTTWVGNSGLSAATAAATEFSQRLYPLLREALP